MATHKFLNDDGVKYLFSKIKGSSPTFYSATGGRVTYAVTIPQVTALTDGLSINVYFPVQSNTNCTLNVNGLGDKAIYLTVGGTRVSTTIPAACYTTLVYNAAHDYWVWVRAYDSGNSNTIGYQVRTNSQIWKNGASTAIYRYQILVETANGLEAFTSTSNKTTANKTQLSPKYVVGGTIRYYSTTTTISSGANIGATVLWQQYAGIRLEYSFNIVQADIVNNSDCYIKMSVNSDGTLSPVYSASSAGHPLVFELPTTADGYVYLFLGKTYTSSDVKYLEMDINHPIYEYKNSKIRLYKEPLASSEVTSALGYTPANSANLGTAASKNTGTGSGNVPVLDSNGKLAESVLPSIAITDTFTAASDSAMTALSAQKGDICIRTDVNKTFILSATPATTLSNWKELKTPTDLVTSVAGRTGAVTLTASDVGLGNVLNKAINVTSSSVSDGTNTFEKYAHPSYNTATASAVKVGRDSTGHVVLGNSLTASDVGALATGTTLDSINDGSTRKLANYLPKSGGTMTGQLKWQDANALPRANNGTEAALEYILGIRAFSAGGGTLYEKKSEFLSGYATESWVENKGYTTNGVTAVKVGANGTNLTPNSSGIVTIPAYPTTLPASDVSAWAKASTKPSYTYSEVGAAAASHTHTKSQITDFPTSMPANGGNSDTVDGYHAEQLLVYANYKYHDIAAFCNASTPLYEVSADGSTGWTAATLNKDIFAAKENYSFQVTNTSQKGARFTWKGGISWSSICYAIIGWTYQATPATITLKFESSADSGSTWTDRGTITGITANATPVLYSFSNPNGDAWFRVSIIQTSSTGAKNISTIKLLTSRWGDQGLGSEYEKPYVSDGDKTIRAWSNNTQLLGTSSYKWKEIHGVTIYENGTALSSKYLGVSDKAADADKLDGHDSSYFINTSNIDTQSVAYASNSGNATFAVNSSKLNDQEASYYLNYNNLNNKPTIPSVSNATITIKQSGRSDQTFTLNGSAATINLDNTTYSAATQSAAGLMSSTDKTRLDNIYTALNGTDSSKIDTIAEVYAFLDDYSQTTDLATQLATKVPTTRKVNNKALSEDISLTASDVGAATSNHNHDNTYLGKTAQAADSAKLGGIAASSYLTSHQDISGKLDKLTYEWNKAINFGSSGYLKIGSFPMYDSNITINIDATTSKTYHGTVIIASQNVSTTSIGSVHKVEVYDDPSGEIASAIRVVWTSGSRNYDVYFVPQAWSKNIVHIRASALSAAPVETEICKSMTGTAPTSTAGLEAVNILTTKFASLSHTHTKSEITDFPTSMPASDVSAWAKAASKPSYTLDEVSDGSTRKLADYMPLAGTTTLTGNIVPSVDSTSTSTGVSLGSSSKKFNFVNARTLKAIGDAASDTSFVEITSDEDNGAEIRVNDGDENNVYYYLPSTGNGGTIATQSWVSSQGYKTTDNNYYPTRSYSSGLQISTSTNVTNTCALYVPYATDSQYGVVKVAGVKSSAETTTQLTSGFTSYGVQRDSNGKLYVRVPTASSSTTKLYMHEVYLSFNSGYYCKFVFYSTSSNNVTMDFVAPMLYGVILSCINDNEGENSDWICIKDVRGSNNTYTAYFSYWNQYGSYNSYTGIHIDEEIISEI